MINEKETINTGSNIVKEECKVLKKFPEQITI